MFTEDLSVFFDDDDFAIAATYTPYGGGAATVKVIFDAAHLEQLGIGGSNPVALGKASDFSAVVANGQDQIVISGVTYRIKDAPPQDDGAIVLLQLEKQ